VSEKKDGLAGIFQFQNNVANFPAPSGSSPDIGSSRITSLGFMHNRLRQADALQHAFGKFPQLNFPCGFQTHLLQHFLNALFTLVRTESVEAREIVQPPLPPSDNR